ncbi:MAG: DUF1566 domain-containing protein [Pseudomonadota bacterium]
MQISTFKLTVVALCLTAAMSSAVSAQERYAVSADNLEVTDSKTGLIWRRCAEGMVWKGKTCTGEAVFLNQAAAAARAKEAAAAGPAWRLPTMKELSSIVAPREADVDKAAIDPTVFPATPLARFWTSSSVGTGSFNVGTGYFMYVAFTEGSAGEAARTAPGAVRLVREAK